MIFAEELHNKTAETERLKDRTDMRWTVLQLFAELPSSRKGEGDG
jgi:hypothetical protein